jgi:hypothetical protein
MEIKIFLGSFFSIEMARAGAFVALKYRRKSLLGKWLGNPREAGQYTRNAIADM